MSEVAIDTPFVIVIVASSENGQWTIRMPYLS